MTVTPGHRPAATPRLGDALLSTAPPEVSPEQALQVAQAQFGLQGPIAPLPGERDRNFLLHIPAGGRAIVKFVSRAEPAAETAFQVAVLRHLASRSAASGKGAAPTPHALSTLRGDDFGSWTAADGATIRVRAYTFLEGTPALQVEGSAALRQSFGRALAALDVALQDYHHEGLQRVFLWDLMQLPSLAPCVHFIRDTALRATAQALLEAFDHGIRPLLGTLRMQAIHNDLSKSNFIVAADDHADVTGILDFGDMAYAPLVCDLAIGASYQMSDAADPLRALEEIREGFESVLPLRSDERDLLLDLVVARLAQRLIVTEWRAHQFPANRDYILRHYSAACDLLARLAPLCQQRSRHAPRRPT